MTDYSLLCRLAELPPDAHAWVDFVSGVLKLPAVYASATYRVIGQNRWQRLTRKGDNPLGYVKTATMHEALRMGLATERFNPTEPRVATKDRAGHVELPPIPEGVAYEDHINALHAKAGLHTACAEEPFFTRVPAWLRDASGAVDWEKVARHAVSKQHMAPAVARVLGLRAEGYSLPRVAGSTSSSRKRDDMVAAWWWIERHLHDRIAPLFQREKQPLAPQRKAKFIPPAALFKTRKCEVYAPSIARQSEHSARGYEEHEMSESAQEQLRDIAEWFDVPPEAVYWKDGRLQVAFSNWALSLSGPAIHETLLDMKNSSL